MTMTVASALLADDYWPVPSLKNVEWKRGMVLPGALWQALIQAHYAVGHQWSAA